MAWARIPKHHQRVRGSRSGNEGASVGKVQHLAAQETDALAGQPRLARIPSVAMSRSYVVFPGPLDL